jgi:hypothetical protein
MARVDLRPTVQQVRRDLAIAAPGCIVQGGGTHRVGRVHVRAMSNLGLDAIQAAGLNRIVEIGGGE